MLNRFRPKTAINKIHDKNQELLQLGRCVKSKLHASIEPKNEAVVKHLIENNSRAVIISGNGPSLKDIDYNLLPENPIIFRSNLFFLEDKYYLGKNIDAYFWSLYEENLQDKLYEIIISKKYHFGSYFFPMDLNKFNNKRIKINKLHESTFQPSYDHWAIIATKPELSRLMMSRPLPTTGLQMIAVAMILGYTNIYIVGIDFYQSTDKRYAFEIPATIKNAMDAKHTTPGYEKGAHTYEYDLFFLFYLIKLYPNVKLHTLSKNSIMSSILD